MRYAHTELGSPPIGVEPQPHKSLTLASVKITDYHHINVVTVCDKDQLQQVVDLLRAASVINGWGELT